MKHSENVLYTTIRTIEENKYTALTVLLSIIILSFVIAFLKPVKYSAQVKFNVVSKQSSSTAKGLASSLSIPGLSFGQSDDVMVNLAIMESAYLTKEFIEKKRLLPVLYSDKWDKETGSWILKKDEKAPSLWKANQFFKAKIRTIGVDKASKVVTMTILWTDAKVAATWANEFVSFADRHIAETMRKETIERISFIRGQLAANEQSEVKQTLVYLLQEELKKLVMLAPSQSYVFKVIDPAVAPELKSEPLRGLIIIVGSFLGMLLAIFAVLLKKSIAVYLEQRKSDLDAKTQSA